MIEAKRLLVVVVLFVSIQTGASELRETARQTRMVETMDAYAYDINKCLFMNWMGVKKQPTVLVQKNVRCNRRQLCYNPNNDGIAQFAVCFNLQKNIPEFSGHIVLPNIKGSGKRDGFRSENSIDGVATTEDYREEHQRNLYGNYNYLNKQFFTRGHLTPNGDFSSERERDFTMITTNIAPHWDPLNNGNWKELEEALRKYATQTQNSLYMITGTSGEAKNENNQNIALNGRVVAPGMFWKAVCDPKSKQSILFWEENGQLDDRNKMLNGCFNKKQRMKNGVIHCSSINEARKFFYIPAFNEKSCSPSEKGSSFKTCIKNFQ